jgi:cysteine sulfinate desulfinase/cysteine desulfurase-like protein
MNVPPEVCMGALRLSLGRGNDISQIEEAAGQIIAIVNSPRLKRRVFTIDIILQDL